jgi:hypothetical protein
MLPLFYPQPLQVLAGAMFIQPTEARIPLAQEAGRKEEAMFELVTSFLLPAQPPFSLFFK